MDGGAGLAVCSDNATIRAYLVTLSTERNTNANINEQFCRLYGVGDATMYHVRANIAHITEL